MNESSLRAGAAEAVVPSAAGLDLAGYVARHNPSTGSRDAITVRALALCYHQNLAIVLSADVLGFSIEDADRLRTEIARRVRAARIAAPLREIVVLLAATHTHSAPASQALRGCGEPDAAWLQTLHETVLHTAHAAVTQLQPARAGCAIGRLPGVAGNRRGVVPAAENAPSPTGSSHGPADDEIGVLRVETLDGDCIARMVNFACHPVVLGGDNLDISADYPGVVAQRLGERGGVTLFLNGACGDVNPRQRGSYDALQLLGEAIAGRAAEIERKVEAAPQVLAASRARHLDLPWVPLPPRAQLKALAQQFGCEAQAATSAGQLRAARAFEQWAKDALQNGAPPLEAEIAVLRLGAAVLVAIPGELFAALGLQIKARLHEALEPRGLRAVFISTYSNGNIGYIPDCAAYEAGGYEVETAHRFYRQPSCLAPAAGARIVESAVSLARELFIEEV